MNRVRLERDARFLENLNPNEDFKGKGLDQFDLKEWTCDSAACAIGFIGSTEAANAEGFTLAPIGSRVPLKPKRLEPVFEGRTGWAAVEEYYGLNNTEAEFIFNFGIPAARTPSDVAGRIRDLMRLKQSWRNS